MKDLSVLIANRRDFSASGLISGQMVPKHSGLEPMLPPVFACVLIALRYSHSHSSPYPISCSFPLFNLPTGFMHPPLHLRFAIHKSIYLFIEFLFGAYHAHYSSPGLHTFTHTGRFLCYCPLPLLASGDFLSFVKQIIYCLLSKAFPNNLSSSCPFLFNEKSFNFFSEVSCFDSIICFFKPQMLWTVVIKALQMIRRIKLAL